MSEDERVSVGCKVEPDVKRDLRMLAAARDTTMSALLRDEIEDLLDSADDVPSVDSQTEEQPAD